MIENDDRIVKLDATVHIGTSFIPGDQERCMKNS